MSWWHISDHFPNLMKECESMATIVCKASDLKCDNYAFKGSSYFAKSCNLCDHAAYENVEHMILSCPYNIDFRTEMFNELANTDGCKEIWNVLSNSSILKVILGGKPDNMEFPDLVPVWCIAAKWVHKMYMRTVNERAGVG